MYLQATGEACQTPRWYWYPRGSCDGGWAAAVADRNATPRRLGHTDDTLAEGISAGTAVRGRIDSGAADADRVVAGNTAAGTVGQVQWHQPLLRICSTRRRVLG